MNPISFLTQMVRIAIPYLFAASGGVVAERSGIVSLTLEGFMLSGAFAAVLALAVQRVADRRNGPIALVAGLGVVAITAAALTFFWLT